MWIKYTKEKLEPIVSESKSIGDVLVKLGLFKGGGNHCHISKTIKKFGIDISHFVKYKSTLMSGKKDWSYHLVFGNKDRRLDAKIARRCLIEYGKKYNCECCGNNGNWNGKKLTLQVDHINENKKDNRPENLRFLCPNCHTQTRNYAGKKNK